MKSGWLFVGFSSAFLLFLLVYEDELRLGWGYEINSGVYSDKYIKRYDEIVVERTIVDFQVLPEYIIGLRLKTKDINCNYKPLRIILDEHHYFTLALDETKVTHFDSSQEFENHLEVLSLKNQSKLNYDFFSRIFKNGRRLDTNKKYKDCLNEHNIKGKVVSA